MTIVSERRPVEGQEKVCNALSQFDALCCRGIVPRALFLTESFIFTYATISSMPVMTPPRISCIVPSTRAGVSASSTFPVTSFLYIRK